MRVLVVGGAGYVGSHVVFELIEKGYDVSVVDNLSTGHRQFVPEGIQFYEDDAYSPRFHSEVLIPGRFDAVMHFAAHSLVGESVENPRKYFENNVGGGLRLIGACIDAGVRYFIFSSSAAVYGEPKTIPIPETAPRLPTNPYGMTKLAIENALESYGKAYGLKSISLRYFNAAGAHPSGRIGELHNPETHLIPNVLKSALFGTEVEVFGTDYATSDGTAVRDYVHVCDISTAHVMALEVLVSGYSGGPFNLGSGKGHSVSEIITVARRVTGLSIPSAVRPRRKGDPPVLVADYCKISSIVSWEPRCSSITNIMKTAWNWHARMSLVTGGAP